MCVPCPEFSVLCWGRQKLLWALVGMVAFQRELCSVWFSSYVHRVSGFLRRLGRGTTAMVSLSAPSTFLWLPQITLAALILFFCLLDSERQEFQSFTCFWKQKYVCK